MHRRLAPRRRRQPPSAPPASPPPALAQSAPEVRWRIASAFPRNLDVLYGTGERHHPTGGGATDNKFQIHFFAAGEIVPGLQVLDAVQTGTDGVRLYLVDYYIGKDPSFVFLTSLPLGLNVRQHLPGCLLAAASRWRRSF